jgi:hypothetical protein
MQDFDARTECRHTNGRQARRLECLDRGISIALTTANAFTVNYQ